MLYLEYPLYQLGPGRAGDGVSLGIDKHHVVIFFILIDVQQVFPVFFGVLLHWFYLFACEIIRLGVSYLEHTQFNQDQGRIEKHTRFLWSSVICGPYFALVLYLRRSKYHFPLMFTRLSPSCSVRIGLDLTGGKYT